jgi:hypothetical protein
MKLPNRRQCKGLKAQILKILDNVIFKDLDRINRIYKINIDQSDTMFNDKSGQSSCLSSPKEGVASPLILACPDLSGSKKS